MSKSGRDLWLAEMVATFGLVFLIFGCLRTGRADAIGLAVGGHSTAAYWFTSSTSFANPGVTLARTLSDTFAGIQPAIAPSLIAVRFLFPTTPDPEPSR